MFNTLFYPTTMNRKEYLIAQGNVQKDVSALAETLKTQLAVFPEAIKVGEELKVIGFKGETLNDLYLICTRGEDEEVYELKYTILTRKSQDGLTTPSEIPCNETVQEKYKDKLQFIYSIIYLKYPHSGLKIWLIYLQACCGCIDTLYRGIVR